MPGRNTTYSTYSVYLHTTFSTIDIRIHLLGSKATWYYVDHRVVVRHLGVINLPVKAAAAYGTVLNPTCHSQG